MYSVYSLASSDKSRLFFPSFHASHRFSTLTNTFGFILLAIKIGGNFIETYNNVQGMLSAAVRAFGRTGQRTLVAAISTTPVEAKDASSDKPKRRELFFAVFCIY